jgi:hypothetical protein
MTMKIDNKILFAIVAAFLLSFIMGAILSDLNPPVSLEYIAYNSLLSMPLTLLSTLLFLKTRSGRQAKALEEDLIECLYSMLYYKTNKLTTYSTMLRVARNADSTEARRIMESAARRVRLGESLGWALSSACSGSGCGILQRLSDSGDKDAYNAIRKALDSYEYSVAESKARVEESIQKYATVNMFLATVLPSFVIFSFMGGIVLTQRDSSLFLLSMAMLIVLPFMYLIGTVFLNRRLYG